MKRNMDRTRPETENSGVRRRVMTDGAWSLDFVREGGAAYAELAAPGREPRRVSAKTLLKMLRRAY